MAETKLTVGQIRDLGLWDKVCEYKGWDSWILKEGKIEENEIVIFDSEFKKKDNFILTDAHELAEFLHSETCNSNHTDGCGWHYESDWDGYQHKRYLKTSSKLLSTGVNVEDIKNIISIIQGY